jgi:hypothetical protein
MSEPQTHPLSTVLGALKRSVSKQLPENPFWLPHYHDFNVFSPAKHGENSATSTATLSPEAWSPLQLTIPGPASKPTPLALKP